VTSKIVVSRAKPLGHRHFIHDLKPSWVFQIPSYDECPPRVSLLLPELVQFKYYPRCCHNRYTAPDLKCTRLRALSICNSRVAATTLLIPSSTVNP